MAQVAVLVIEKGAAEATLIHAALARCTEVRVVESLGEGSTPIALAIAGSTALTESPDKLVKSLESRGIPLIGIAAGLSKAAKKRALAAGVKEIHDRPREWRPYCELIDQLVGRFTRSG